MHIQEWRQRQRERRQEVSGDFLRCRDPAIDYWFNEVAAERDCPEDCVDAFDEELAGLTILEHPHITGQGSIVASRLD